MIRFQIFDCRNRTMAGNDLGVGRNLCQGIADVFDQSFDAAAATQINEREHAREEIVAHMHDVRLREKDHAVTVRVAVGVMNRLDLFAVEMHRERFVESDHRQRLFRGGGNFLSGAVCAFHAQPFADVRVRDDGRINAEDGVAAGVVAVPVRIDDEFEFALAQLFQGGFDLVGQRRELIINDQDAVRADRYSDVSAGTFQHIDVAGDHRGLYLDFGKILPLSEGKAGKQAQGKQNRDGFDSHRLSPCNNHEEAKNTNSFLRGSILTALTTSSYGG